MTQLLGSVYSKLGDNVSTDDITSAKYVTSTEPAELAKICMRDLDPEFMQKMKNGGLLIGGRNFGCGSSREWAPIALKAAGVKAVLAEEFARIFYRNALNVGLPLMEYPNISECCDLYDLVDINLKTGMIENKSKGIILEGKPLPQFLLDRMEMGGLAEYLRRSRKDLPLR